MSSQLCYICRLIILTFNSYHIFAYDYVVSLFRRNSSTFEIEKRCPAAGAMFGSSLSDEDLIGCHFFTTPVNGCSKIQPPAQLLQLNISRKLNCIQFIAVIERGNCTYANKAYLAQQAGFQAVIVYDNEPGSRLLTMGGDGIYDSKISISAFFIVRSCGLYLSNFSYDAGNMILISQSSVELARYMLPFVVIVGVCFVFAMLLFGIKLLRDKRRECRRRLSRRNLKKIPTKKFKKYDTPETCPICLEDFDDGDRLRILPCSHWYHAKCVDPWLTKNRKVCPVCKRKVIRNDNDSDVSSLSSSRTSIDNSAVLDVAVSSNTTPLPRSRGLGAMGNDSTITGVEQRADGDDEVDNFVSGDETVRLLGTMKGTGDADTVDYGSVLTSSYCSDNASASTTDECNEKFHSFPRSDVNIMTAIDSNKTPTLNNNDRHFLPSVSSSNDAEAVVDCLHPDTELITTFQRHCHRKQQQKHKKIAAEIQDQVNPNSSNLGTNNQAFDYGSPNS